MDNQKIEAILDSLLKLSEERKLDWKKTANDSTYLLTLEDSSISVANFFDANAMVQLNLRDDKGISVEEKTFDNSTPLFEKSMQLYDLARRKATNADATLDRILEQLNSGKIAA